MWKETIPKIEGKLWVTAAKGCDKIIFEILDGTLCSIGAVHVGQEELKTNAFLVHEGFEGCWALVVQHLEGWAETALGQIGVQTRVCVDEFVLAS